MGFGGFGEMLFIMLLGLLLFGPKKLPEIARQVGKVLGEFKKASAEFQAQLNDEVRRLESSVPEVNLEEDSHSIAPPRLQDSAPRNETPQYALEPNSGQHEGEAPAQFSAVGTNGNLEDAAQATALEAETNASSQPSLASLSPASANPASEPESETKEVHGA